MAPTQPTIANYDDKTADQVTQRLRTLSQADLAKLEAYERDGQARSTVLDAITSLREREPWSGYDDMEVEEVNAALREGDGEAPVVCSSMSAGIRGAARLLSTPRAGGRRPRVVAVKRARLGRARRRVRLEAGSHPREPARPPSPLLARDRARAARRAVPARRAKPGGPLATPKERRAAAPRVLLGPQRGRSRPPRPPGLAAARRGRAAAPHVPLGPQRGRSRRPRRPALAEAPRGQATAPRVPAGAARSGAARRARAATPCLTRSRTLQARPVDRRLPRELPRRESPPV